MYFRGAARTSSVCIVTEYRVLGDALAYVLRLRVGLRRVVVCRDSVEIDRAVGSLQPAVVLFDVHVGAAEETVRRMSRAWPGAPIIFFGCHDPHAELQACHRRGDRRIPPDATCEQLLDVLQASLRSPASLVHSPVRREDCTSPATESEADLSPREWEIAALLAQGLLNREIASRLGVSVATVKNHVHHILTKLHAHSRGQALARLRDHRGDEL